MKRKKIIVSVLLIAVLAGSWYGYGEYNRKPKDLARTKADISITSSSLLYDFSTNEKNANAKYLDKILSVSGSVKSVEKNEQGYYTILMAEEGKMSSIRCSMATNQHEDFNIIKPGILITVKGLCIGYTSDELLGADIILNRCVIQQ